MSCFHIFDLLLQLFSQRTRSGFCQVLKREKLCLRTAVFLEENWFLDFIK
jgi:hypothetical protein